MGLGKCSLYKSDWEGCLHIFVLCHFSLDIWKKVPSLLGIQVSGDMYSIAAWICSWERQWKGFQVVPIYVFFFGIWCSQNEFIFEEISPDAKLSSLRIIAHFRKIGHWCPKESSRTISLVDLSNNFIIFFFDKASASGHCGCGFSLHINSKMFCRFKWFGGFGDNCKPKMLALWGAFYKWLSDLVLIGSVI